MNGLVVTIEESFYKDMFLCLMPKVISWCSRKQQMVALFSIKAKFITAIEVTTWLRRIYANLQQSILEPTSISFVPFQLLL